MTELKNTNWQADALPEADFLSDSAAAPYGKDAADIPPPPPDDNWITIGAKPFPLPDKR